MRIAPQERAQRNDDQRRNQPDDGIGYGGIGPVGSVAGIAVGGSISPGKQEGHDEDRDDHDQHQDDGGEQEVALGQRNGTFRVEDGVCLRSQPLPSRAAPRAIAVRRDLRARACFTIASILFA